MTVPVSLPPDGDPRAVRIARVYIFLLPRRIYTVAADRPGESGAAPILDPIHNEHCDQQCLAVSGPVSIVRVPRHGKKCAFTLLTHSNSNLVTIPFHQIVRAMTPFFTVIIYRLFFAKTYSTMTYISLVPVVAGVGFATAGDYYFTAVGFFLTLLGAFLAALKTVVTNRIQTGRLKLSPLEILHRMSPLAFVQTLVYAYFSGEMGRLQKYAEEEMGMREALILFLNGTIAFALNVISFTANKKTGALTMTVAANVKQILTIVLSIMFWGLAVSWLNGVGILLTLAGGAWYAYVPQHSVVLDPQLTRKPGRWNYKRSKHARRR